MSRKCDLHAQVGYFCGMKEKSDRLRQARERAGYTSARQAAEAMGVPVASYTQHESGLRGFRDDLATRYATFFKVPVEWLLLGTRRGDADTFIALGPRLYMKGEVAAGVWKDAWELPADEWEVFTGRADIAAPVRERFGLRVVGESMNLVYPPGSILECVAYNGQTVPNGKRVIVRRTRFDGSVECTVKEFVQEADGAIWLVPRSTSPAFQAPIRADQPSDDVASVEVVGIVVASIRPE